MTASFELAVTRLIDAPPEKVYRVWTERLTEWWCPKPWTTEIIAHDMRPGGRSAMVMRGPNGESAPMEGVFLEVAPNQRIVLTDAFADGWIPQTPFMIGIFTFAPEGGKTRYTAAARHWSAEDMKRHEEMGFHPGWDIVADQFQALVEGAQAKAGEPLRR